MVPTNPTGQPSMKPSSQPVSEPTALPTSPTGQPSQQPTQQPSRQPTRRPSRQPTQQPSSIPSTQPSAQPSRQPTRQPTSRPSRRPTAQPSSQPTRQPSMQPTRQPTDEPTAQPTGRPSRQPSGQPTRQPTSQPSAQPSRQPSAQPSRQPSAQPSRQPTRRPSRQPTQQPSSEPTKQPSSEPTKQPSSQPSGQPSRQPSRQPTAQPSRQPTTQPSRRPTAQPSRQPSQQPSGQPSVRPSAHPITSAPTSRPSSRPSKYPSTSPPSFFSDTVDPTSTPTGIPTVFYGDYMYSTAWSSYLTQKTLMVSSLGKVPASNVTGGLYFNSFRYKGQLQEGNCSEWTTFLGKTIHLPFDNLYLSYATLYLGIQSTASRARSMVRYQQFYCDDSSVLMKLRQALALGLDYVGRCGKYELGQDHDWRVYTCNGVVVFCIDCIKSCSASACPGVRVGKGIAPPEPTRGRYEPKWIVNPCPLVDCSAKYSTFVNLRFDVMQKITYPALGKISVSEGPNSLTVTTNVSEAANVYCTAVKYVFTSKETLMLRQTFTPTGAPTSQPSRQPSRQPSAQPTRQPSRQPTAQPSRQPTSAPTNPSSQPTRQPSSQPSRQPSSRPTRYALNPKVSRKPTGQPTRQPTSQPSRQPFGRPTGQPSRRPSGQPTCVPTGKPVLKFVKTTPKPSRKPTAQPSSHPSGRPSSHPSRIPSGQPSSAPSALPTNPTGQPTSQPSIPTGRPTQLPGDEIYYTPPEIYSVFDVKRVGAGSGHAEVLDYSAPVSIVLPGLWRDMQYRVYCYTEDPLLRGMNLPAVRENFFDTKTLCCKSLYWTNSMWERTTTLIQGSTTGDAEFSFAFLSPPSYNQYFEAFVAPSQDCPPGYPAYVKGSPLPVITPTLFNISMGSTHLVRSFRVTTSVLGCFQLLIYEAGLIEVPVSVVISGVNTTTGKPYKTPKTVYVPEIHMNPTAPPTALPTTRMPSRLPTVRPTLKPIKGPTPAPTAPTAPRGVRPGFPTAVPSPRPSVQPTPSPTESSPPTPLPTKKNQRPYHVSTVVNIVPSSTPYPQPQLNRCYFSDDGMFLLCDFDISTDRARLSMPKEFTKTFLCAKVLSFPTSDNVRCEWVTELTIRARLGEASAKLNSLGIAQLPYDVSNPAMITLVGGMVRAACQTAAGCGSTVQYPYAESSSAYIDPIDNPALTSASLSIAPVIGPCDVIELDATATQGSAGRPWGNLLWLLTGLDSSLNVTQLAYNQYMNTEFNATNKVWTLPRQLVNYFVVLSDTATTVGNYSLPLETRMVFSLNVVNFLGGSSTTTARTMLSLQTLLPNIRIVGRSAIIQTRDAPLNLISQVRVPPWCGPMEFNSTGTVKVGELVVTLTTGTQDIAIGSWVIGPKKYIQSGTWVTARTRGTVTLSATAYQTGSNIRLTFRYPTAASLRYEYRWSVYQGFQFIPKFPSESNDDWLFKISPFKFLANQRYAVSVSATVKLVRNSDQEILNTASASAQVTVDVRPSGVKALIEGGERRYVDPKLSPVLVLDGSKSYDKDYPPLTSKGSPTGLLGYSWSCLQFAPVFGGPCPFAANATTSKLTIDTKKLVRSESYNLLLQVFNINGARDNATILVVVVPVGQSVPFISIPPQKIKYNPTDKITVEAYLSTGGASGVLPVSYQWSGTTASTSLSLTDLSLTPTSSQIPVSAAPSLVQLALRKDSLGVGQTYVFSLTATYSSDMSAFSLGTVTIVTNAPPTSGTFSVTPATGTAVTMPFIFSAAGWLDDPSDYPLSYIMSYYVTGPLFDSTLVKSSSPLAITSAYLSAGVLGNTPNYGVTAVCNICDTFGAQTATSFTVIVNPSSDSLTAVATAAASILATAITEGQVSTVRQVIASLTAQANSAECSLVPPFGNKACLSLNRLQCSTVDNTCGNCLDGFVGVNGASNTMCVPAASASALQPLGGPCTAGADCTSTVCTGGVCSARSKRCPSNCAAPVTSLAGVISYVSRGTCTFFAGYEPPFIPTAKILRLGPDAPQYVPMKTPISTCGDTNATCTAMCLCNRGYYGQSCALTNTTLTAQRQIRSDMCNAVRYLAGTKRISQNNKELPPQEDSTPEVLYARAVNIASIMSDFSLMTLDSIGVCTYAMIDTVMTDPMTSASDQPFSQIMQTLSSVLQLGSLLDPTLKKDVFVAMQTLASSRQNALAVDEAGTTVTTDTARVWVSKVSTGSGLAFDGASATVPLTPVELAAGALPATFKLSSTSSRRLIEHNNATGPSSNSSRELQQSASPTLGTGVVGITLVQYVNHPNALSTNSTPVTMQLRFYDYDGKKSPDLSHVLDNTFVTITMRNHFPFKYSSREVEIVSEQCHAAAQPLSIPVTCSLFENQNPGGFAIECPGDWLFGIMHAHCPSKKEVPQCALWDSAVGQYVINHRCTLISYDEKSTTCECPLGALPHTRRLAGEKRERYFTQGVELDHVAMDFLNDYLDSQAQDIAMSSSSSRPRLVRPPKRRDPEGSLVMNEQPPSDYVSHDHRGVGPEEDDDGNQRVSRRLGEAEDPKFDAEALESFARPEHNSRGRQLLSTSQVTFEFTSNFEIQGTNFNQVFEENGMNLIETVVKDSVIFSTCILLLAAGLVGFVGFWSLDYRTTFHHNPKYIKYENHFKLPILRTFESFFGKVLPKEFQPRPWFMRVYNKLLTDHDWLVLLLGFDEERDFKLSKWCLCVGKILNFMIADILLGLVYYADDGTCQKFTDTASCEATLSIDRVTPLCEWVYDYRSCRYRAITKKFASTIVITMVITIFASVFDKLLRFLVGQTRRFCERMPKLLGQGNKLTVDSELGDEMKDSQSKPATILRAARLQWMIANMDYVPPDEELRIMVLNSTRDSWLPGDWRPTATNNYLRAIQRDLKHRLMEFNEEGNPRSASLLMSLALSNSRELIQRKLLRARMRAEAVKRTLSTIRLDQDKDMYLIRRFLVDSLPGYRRLVAQHYFFGKEETEEFYKDQPLYVLKICTACLGLYYIIATTVVLYFGVGIGSKATNLWLLGVITALAQDMFLLQPLRIVVKFVFITNSCNAELLALFEVLATRARTLTKRNFGLMKNKNALVQHFNPACRAARSVPTLPVARLLMSLTDYDLPITHKIRPLLPQRTFRTPLVVGMPPRDVAWYSWQRVVASPLWSDLYHATVLNFYYAMRSAYDRLIWAVFMSMAAFLTVLMFLPDPVQTIIVEALVTVLSNCTFLAYYYSQVRVSALVCFILVAVTLGFIWYGWSKFYIYDKLVARGERKKRLAYNEAVRARRAYKRFIAEGAFTDEANRERGYYFKERDPLAQKQSLQLSEMDEYGEDGYNEESKMSPKSKPGTGRSTRDLALSFSSFPFSTPTKAARVHVDDTPLSIDVASAPPSPTGIPGFSFFGTADNESAAGTGTNPEQSQQPQPQPQPQPQKPPPESNSLVDIVRARLAPLSELPGFSSIPAKFQERLREGMRHIYRWTHTEGAADPPSSLAERPAMVLPASKAAAAGQLDSHSVFKSVRGPPMQAKKPAPRHNLITGLSLVGDRNPKGSTNPYIVALGGGQTLGATRSPGKEEAMQVKSAIDAAAASALAELTGDRDRRGSKQRSGRRGSSAGSGGGGGGGGDSSLDEGGSSLDELGSAHGSAVKTADGSKRVKKHGKHRQPFKPKGDNNDASSVLTADSGSTSSLQRHVRRALRRHIGPGRVALEETDEERAFTEAMGDDKPANQLIVPAKAIHGDIPGSTVLSPEMFGDGLVQVGMPVPTSSPTTRSPKKGLKDSAASAAASLSVSDGRPMSTGNSLERRRNVSPQDLARSQVISAGGSLDESPTGSPSLVGGAGTGGSAMFDQSLSTIGGGAAPPGMLSGFGFSSPLRRSNGLGGATVTENGRTVEYSTLRGHKQRVVRTLTAMQQDDPSLQVHADQDPAQIRALAAKQAARDAAQRAQDASKIVSQRGATFIPPASVPAPIRPTPPRKVVQEEPAKLAFTEKEEPPKYPLYY